MFNKQFLADLIIGWIIYTENGKKTANNIIEKAVNYTKKNLLTKNNVNKEKENDNKPKM